MSEWKKEKKTRIGSYLVFIYRRFRLIADLSFHPTEEGTFRFINENAIYWKTSFSCLQKATFPLLRSLHESKHWNYNPRSKWQTFQSFHYFKLRLITTQLICWYLSAISMQTVMVNILHCYATAKKKKIIYLPQRVEELHGFSSRECCYLSIFNNNQLFYSRLLSVFLQLDCLLFIHCCSNCFISTGRSYIIISLNSLLHFSVTICTNKTRIIYGSIESIIHLIDVVLTIHTQIKLSRWERISRISLVISRSIIISWARNCSDLSKQFLSLPLDNVALCWRSNFNSLYWQPNIKYCVKKNIGSNFKSIISWTRYYSHAVLSTTATADISHYVHSIIASSTTSSSDSNGVYLERGNESESKSIWYRQGVWFEYCNAHDQ